MSNTNNRKARWGHALVLASMAIGLITADLSSTAQAAARQGGGVRSRGDGARSSGPSGGVHGGPSRGPGRPAGGAPHGGKSWGGNWGGGWDGGYYSAPPLIYDYPYDEPYDSLYDCYPPLIYTHHYPYRPCY